MPFSQNILTGNRCTFLFNKSFVAAYWVSQSWFLGVEKSHLHTVTNSIFHTVAQTSDNEKSAGDSEYTVFKVRSVLYIVCLLYMYMQYTIYILYTAYTLHIVATLLVFLMKRNQIANLNNFSGGQKQLSWLWLSCSLQGAHASLYLPKIRKMPYFFMVRHTHLEVY